jgi:hypothetical protein
VGGNGIKTGNGFGEVAVIQLQDRDRRLLKLCYEHQFITFDHVEFEFQGTHVNAARRRVGLLEKAGYLVRKEANSESRKFYFRLTPKGQEIGRAESSFELNPSAPLNMNQLDHDAVITSVRQRIASRWTGAAYHPERALKEADYGLVPDGAFVFEDGAQVPIEIENSDKGRTRLTDLLKRWEAMESVLMVIYITTNTSLERLVKRSLEDVSPELLVGVVPWESLKSGFPKVWTQRGYANLFEVSRL